MQNLCRMNVVYIYIYIYIVISTCMVYTVSYIDSWRVVVSAGSTAKVGSIYLIDHAWTYQGEDMARAMLIENESLLNRLVLAFLTFIAGYYICLYTSLSVLLNIKCLDSCSFVYI